MRHAGHDVRFYAMDYPQNIACEESRYFAEEISFSAPGLQERIKAACRILWGSGVAESFNRILDEFRPDVVHLNNIHSYLSPVVARLAHQRGIKVLWTLHDYKLICPSYSCLCQGKPCEACFVDKKKVVSRRCMKNSLLASLLAFGEAVNWNRDKLSAWTDCFVCPSRFMAEKMRQGGFPVHKLQVVANFIGTEQAQCIADTPDCVREEAYAYIGRLSPEKGIESLLEAATRLPYTLYIAGRGPSLPFAMKTTPSALSNLCVAAHPYWGGISAAYRSYWRPTTPIGFSAGMKSFLLQSQECSRTPLLSIEEGCPPLHYNAFPPGVIIKRGARLQKKSEKSYLCAQINSIE